MNNVLKMFINEREVGYIDGFTHNCYRKNGKMEMGFKCHNLYVIEPLSIIDDYIYTVELVLDEKVRYSDLMVPHPESSYIYYYESAYPFLYQDIDIITAGYDGRVLNIN